MVEGSGCWAGNGWRLARLWLRALGAGQAAAGVWPSGRRSCALPGGGKARTQGSAFGVWSTQGSAFWPLEHTLSVICWFAQAPHRNNPTSAKTAIPVCAASTQAT
eukprot:360024-Chlamydomonas_euryale.AAC.4